MCQISRILARWAVVAVAMALLDADLARADPPELPPEEPPGLTAIEQRWLDGAMPAIAWALRQGLPIDVVVLPRAVPGDAPLAMGWAEGRCKLVFSMRGNPAAAHTLDTLPPELLQPTLEAITAHEIGHCQRHRSGSFGQLPGGALDHPGRIERSQPTPELQAAAHDMRVTRREEAYADLVGLAWTGTHHPDRYAAVLAWFEATRADEIAHGFHDTRHWLALAHAPDTFTDGSGLFEQALRVWQRGLDSDSGDR